MASKKVFVLMFDEDASREKGTPVGVFMMKPAHTTLMDYIQADSELEIKAFFKDGYLWYVTTSMGR